MRAKNASAGGLLVFLVYGMFALFSLLLVVIGAGIYRGVVETGQQNTRLRSSLFYLENQMRQCPGGAELQEQGGLPVLVLPAEGGGYARRVYYENGALCEYYGPADARPDPGLGERIALLDDFAVEEPQPGLFRVTVTLDGQTHSMALWGAA